MNQVNTPLGLVEELPFPNRIIKLGDADSALILKIQHRLQSIGISPIDLDGIFDDDTENAVKLFQMRFPDVTGSPLQVDGKIGSLTWGALFGKESVHSSAEPSTALTKEVVEYAKTQIGVLENPLGSNRGPEVDKYQIAAGLTLNASTSKPGYAWCVAFTYYCYQQAAAKLGIGNPHIKTAGVLDHWSRAKGKPGIVRISNVDAINDPTLVKPGALFIIDHGGGLGHSGIVTEVSNGRLVTIEGNTNDGGSRNGIGVFERKARKIADINKGFVDYSSF